MNNTYNFPPLMNDGRQYTNWNSSSCMFKNDFEYRRYLTKHANDIMDRNLKYSMDKTGVSPFHNVNTPYSLKYSHVQHTFEPDIPYKSMIGQNSDTSVYGYEDSDLKRMYASNYALQSRMTYPLK